MSERPPEQDKTITVSKPKEVRVVADSGPLAYIWDTARFEHMFRIADAMALAPIIPDHLRGIKRGQTFEEFTPAQVKGNCFRIVNQAMRWDVDPFAIVDETYVTAGKLGYQGKVVAAIINTKAPLKERLKYSYTGTKGRDDYEITVSGTFIGENEPRTVTLSVGEAKTQNQMWAKDPKQKLIYSGVVRWARAFASELMLGVLTDDDLERMETWRADSAKKAQNARTVEPPDFALNAESQSDASKPQNKGKTAEKETNSEESVYQRLYGVVREYTTPEDFMAGLKLIAFPGIQSDVELLSELSDELCEEIIPQVGELMDKIRDQRWVKGVK